MQQILNKTIKGKYNTTRLCSKPTMIGLMLFMFMVTMATHQDRNVGVVKTIITDTAQHCPSDHTQSPGANNNQVCRLLLRHLHYGLTNLAVYLSHLAANLK